MATLTCRQLVKTYKGGQRAVDGIDLTLEPGELMVVVGPSGCGKSTFLRMVAGLETISDGELRIGGTLANQLEPAQRGVAMVFQNYALYPHMSVFDNMAYALKLQKRPREEITRRVREAAALLGIEALLERRPRQLSGGQRQRVAMGRAIVREPRVFLFDEPLSNLDAALRVQMRLEIRRLQQRLGASMLYVTHDQVEAMTLADRLVVLRDGRIEQIGTPMSLFETPASCFVARFIGSPAMNLLPVTQADGRARLPGGLILDTEALKTEIIETAPETKADTAASADAAEPPAAATLGVRPEHLRLDPQGEFAVTLEMIERLGVDALAYCRLPGLDAPLTARLPLATLEAAALREGSEIRLAVDGPLHLFDAEERRVARRARLSADTSAATSSIA
ncbi:sn-glycerol-3-phosphate ABC transporter ATP-binding protein UgpC [Salinicola endophyticus]|uniref:Sn-glycerol-3-phosphate ABC transporter ATP-binding protein UgpC n=1 Tax=Salinicola endophyticus TaxID=1949083 RepID=A0ABY8FHB0_9GAMM|nr:MULTISPECIES: sn-glycerol-3-phosphate ABC transporter ATP-binding protein UgpC [Salinicola]WFF41460.1 sn-glycerol-3-phosphate ABC transporter ATP-binding protein UgpC [Salinicola endophyticus]